MKKLIIFFLLINSYVVMLSNDPSLIVVLNDGNVISNKLADIESLTFNTFGNSSLMTIYMMNDSTDYFLTNYLDSITVDTTFMFCHQGGIPYKYPVGTIDSITIYSNDIETVPITNKIWAVKNLTVKTYSNGDSIIKCNSMEEWKEANLNSMGTWCYPDFDSTNEETYGVLYNIWAVRDPRGLAPKGWHVSKTSEWNEMQLLFGMDISELNISGVCGNILGGALKTTGLLEEGTGLWKAPNTGATNASGLSVVPAGRLGDAGYFGKNERAEFIVAPDNPNDSKQPYSFRGLRYNESGIVQFASYYDYYGLSIRCIFDKLKTNPYIDTLYPNTIKYGRYINIKGRLFGENQGNNILYIDSMEVTDYQQWSDTAIIALIPENAEDGILWVDINGTTSNKAYFDLIAAPVITAIKPDSGRPGDEIMILGWNFYEEMDGHLVWFDDIYAWDMHISGSLFYFPATIFLIVPQKAKSSYIYLEVDSMKSNSIYFNVIYDPEIDGISPGVANNGDTIVIRGKNFRPYRDTNNVYFMNIPATEYLSWSDTLIYVIVPDSATSGLVWVNTYGYNSNSLRYELVSSPIIDEMIPANSDIGNGVIIKGRNFNNKRGENKIILSDMIIEDYLMWTDKQINFKIPYGASSGTISVEVDGRTSNTEYLYIESSPDIFYDTVKIFDQVWMKRNLDVSHYRNGDPIPQVTDYEVWDTLTTGAWCYYNYNPENNNVIGKLYNCYALTDPRGLAPEGWHLPDFDEIKALIDSLGGYKVAGGKLKATGTLENGDGLWREPNTGATNESGFTALPAGGRKKKKVFCCYDIVAGFGGIDKENNDNFSAFFVNYNGTEVDYYTLLKEEAGVLSLSVRCIKDK